MSKRTCSVDGCDRIHSARGYCKKHLERVRRTGSTELINVRHKCKVDGCERWSDAKDLCPTHYMRAKRHGDPEAEVNHIFSSPEAALAARTRWNGDCLEWTGAVSPLGYGRIRVGEKTVVLHRWVFESKFGELPGDRFVDHICGNPRCCRIEHLRPVTNKQNGENLHRLNSRNTSGYRGVSWSKTDRKWRAVVGHNGKQHSAGLFDDIEEANRAVIELRLKLFTHNELDKTA